MMSSAPRVALRSSRALRAAHVPVKPRVRFQSTSADAKTAGSSGVVGGVVGGSIVFLAGYAYYYTSGAKSIINAAHQTKSQFDNAFKKTAENAPKPNEAITWFKETVQGYTKLIPGASGYVDSAFKDLEQINEKHGPEVEKVVKGSYDELKEATKAGASWAAAIQVWEILQKAMKQIGELAKDSGEEILNNHPQLKEKFGGSFTQLKQMGEQYGPEAKKQVDDTYKQIQDIIKGGLSADNIKKAQDLIKEKTEQVKKYGDEAWSKGMEKAGPALDKYPQVKEFVEKNKDKLQQGNINELWKKAQELSEKGNADDVLKWAKDQVNQVSDGAGDKMEGSIGQLFGMIPNGNEVKDKLQQLYDLSQKHGKEAEDLVKSAFNDVKSVLDKKVKEGEKLKEKAKDDAKS